MKRILFRRAICSFIRFILIHMPARQPAQIEMKISAAELLIFKFCVTISMSNGHPGINVCCTHPSRVDVQVRPVGLGGNMVSLVHMVSLFVVQT